jgi:hypothetical protein
MSRFAPAARLFSRHLLVVACLAAAVPGCSGKPTPEQELDATFANNPKATRLKVAKFEGRVTIDNQPPGDEYSLLHITLMDAEKFKDSTVRRWQARVDKDGSFSFMTYLKHDGVPVGKYVAVFIDPSEEPKRKTANGLGTGMGSPLTGSRWGVDRLKNLYNDPEVNLKNPDFVVEVKEPGITNQTFNLAVVGKDGPPAPGQYAVKRVMVTPGFFLQK